MDRLLSTSAALKYVNKYMKMSMNTLRRRIYSGEIRVIDKGTDRRAWLHIPVSELDKFIKNEKSMP